MSYMTECPWCGQRVSVSEDDEQVYVERHQTTADAFHNRERECGGSGEVYIDVWEEAQAEARLDQEEEDERQQVLSDVGRED
ncbi:MAG: hypothetical protein ACR2GU_03670 [Rubrobacteraceae bacterium]